ncbi:MAG: hypothetical protein QN204_06795 [Armatimonadota bacterium]|nr:hypothetical protein [Armatimonadota bacterium]
MPEAAGGTWEAEALVAEALEAPAVYRALSTEYTDVGRLVEYLGERLFSGVVRVNLPGREACVVLFRGRVQAARYRVEDSTLEAGEAVRSVLADSRWMEGEVWVHQLPEELFPEEWEEREPVPWEAAEAQHPHPEPPEAVRADRTPAEATEGAAAPPPATGSLPETAEPPAEPGLGEPEPARAAPAGEALDVVSWVRLLESFVARFKRYRGPSAASRLEAEVNAALEGSGLRLGRGRVEGEATDPEALRLAAVRAVGFVKGMAGQAFAEQSLAVAMRDAGIRDGAKVKALLET